MKLILQIAAGILLASIATWCTRASYLWYAGQMQTERNDAAQVRLSRLNIAGVRQRCKPIRERVDDIGKEKWYTMELLAQKSAKFSDVLLVPDYRNEGQSLYRVSSTIPAWQMIEEFPCIEEPKTAVK